MTDRLVTPGLQVAQGITEYGILVVIAGFFVLGALLLAWNNERRYTQMIKVNDARMDALLKVPHPGNSAEVLETLKIIIESTQDLANMTRNLVTMSSDVAREEATSAQAERVLKLEIRRAQQSLLDSTRIIVEKNNVEDPCNKTEDKLERVIRNTLLNSRQGLNLFKYKGIRMGNFIESLNTGPLYDLIYTFVMGKTANYGKFESDLNFILTELLTELEQHLSTPS